MYQVIRPSVTEVQRTTCPFHEKHPGRAFPGCTCSTSISTREKPIEEWTEEERRWYFAAEAGEDVDGNPLF
jgi:hypothetical protein